MSAKARGRRSGLCCIADMLIYVYIGLLGQTQEAERTEGSEVERMAGTVALGGGCVHKYGYTEKESGQSLLGCVGQLVATTVSLIRSMVRLDDN
jgi:hypothetical protein